jgi:hypothetical protein
MRLMPSIAVALFFSSLLSSTSVQQGFTGRWNLTGTGENANHVYWLEVIEKDGQLTGMFLNRTASPFALETVRIQDGQLIFQLRAGRNGPTPENKAKLEGDKLVGTIVERGVEVAFVGVRPPRWPEVDASGKHAYGEPAPLFDGGSTDAFTLQHASRPSGWSVEQGAMTNSPRANNLISRDKFTNFRLQAEYKLEAGSNSGLYLRGRYELQVVDDHGKPAEKTGHMAIYGWAPPLVNASKPAGEWQTMEAIIVGNRLTATLNGQKVHDNAVIHAITGGALDADELAPGPIVVQGDHNKVWYRRIVVTPITSIGR